jgi:short subunit dehydrogenase-like uncharacterized protein
MKKASLFLITISTVVLFSCGGGSSSKTAVQEKTTVEKSGQKEQSQQKKQENVYAKDKYLKDIDFKATENKFSEEDWKRISKTCTDFDKEFKKTIPKMNDLETFFKNQGYENYQAGKDDIYVFAGLYKIVVGLPNNMGILRTIKKNYSEEEYKNACNSTAEIYNDQGLSAGDIKNIEKNQKVISDAYSIKMSLEAAEASKGKS